MTVALTSRWLAEYARRPLNLVLLVAVPMILVTLSAGALADFADILGGVADLGEVEAATAGWAAAVLAGVAGFFHVSSDWGRYLPAHGAVRVMMDGAFTPSFDETGALVLALVWLAVLWAAAAAVFRRVTVS